MNVEPHPLPRADLQHVLQHTRDLWRALHRETLFITGGTGPLGRWLLESFCHANRALRLHARAVVLTRRPEHFAACAPHLANDPALHILRGDVRHFDAADLGNLAGSISLVLHAAEPRSSRLSPLRVLDVMYAGTRRVLEWAVTQRISRVVLLGSGRAHSRGAPRILPLREPVEWPGQDDLPVNPLAEGKHLMEVLAAIFREEYRLDCKVARCFGVAGPGMPLGEADPLAVLLQDAIGPLALTWRGDSDALRSYLYLADFAAWIWTLLLRESPSPVYNIGSDEAVSVSAIAEHAAACGAHGSLIPAQTIVAPSGPASGIPDLQRTRRELGVEVWTDFATTVRKTFDYYAALMPQAPAEALAV